MKKLFATLSVLAIVFGITLDASALEVKVKGYGGVTVQRGTTVKVCPNQSKDDCATLTISGGEIKDIKTAFSKMEVDELLQKYTLVIANPEILKQKEVQGCELIIIAKEKK